MLMLFVLTEAVDNFGTIMDQETGDIYYQRQIETGIKGKNVNN